MYQCLLKLTCISSISNSECLEVSFPFKNNTLTSLLYGFVRGGKLVREVVVMDSLRPTYSRLVCLNQIIDIHLMGSLLLYR